MTPTAPPPHALVALGGLEATDFVAPRSSPRAALGAHSGGADEPDTRATALMVRYRDGRRLEDFEALYAETRTSVLHWIRSLLRQSSARLDALELLQDTYVNVFRYPASFRDEHGASFRVWVRTIAGNVVRRARGRTPRSGYLELPAGRHEPIDGHHGPEVQAALSESAEHLGGAYALLLQLYARAFAELSERDRQALALVEVDGLGYAEAAACLGVRPANMKMIVFRARRRLVQRVELWLGGRRALAA